MDERLFTVNEVAERLQINPVTVQRWIRDGRLAAINLGGSAGYRIRGIDIEHLLFQEYGRIEGLARRAAGAEAELAEALDLYAQSLSGAVQDEVLEWRAETLRLSERNVRRAERFRDEQWFHRPGVKFGGEEHGTKSEERAVLESFRQVSGSSELDGMIRQGEKPDFVIESSSGRIGVELTRHFPDNSRQGSKTREAEVLRSQIAKKAQGIFEDRNPEVFLYVYPHFLRTTLNRRELDRRAASLAGLVEDVVPLLPVNSPLVSIEVDQLALQRHALDDIMRGVTVYQWRPATYGLWAVVEAAYANTDVSTLEAIVRNKEAKLPSYAKIDACWLIIYAPPVISASFDLDSLKGQHLASNFERVAFFDVVSMKAVFLK